VKAFSEKASPTGPDQNMVRENDRTRRENHLLKEVEADLEKCGTLFRRSKAGRLEMVRFV
jgi:hypothetical protein